MKLKDTIRFIKKYFSKQKKLFIKSFILLFFSSIIGVSFGYLLGLATENVVLLADYIKSLYTSQGSNGLYRGSNNSSSAFYVGFGDVSAATVSGSVAVRPVFYLTSSTQYVSGSGTQSDPIRIN